MFLQLNRNRYRQHFGTLAARNTADGGRILRIKARTQPDIAVIGATGIGRIKADPAQPRDVKLAPGMRRLVAAAIGARLQIARNIARRNPCHPCGGNQNLRVILANAFALRQGLCRRGVRLGAAGLVGNRGGNRL